MTPIFALQAADVSHGVGLEWMAVLSFVLPVLVLLLIVYLGSKNTV